MHRAIFQYAPRSVTRMPNIARSQLRQVHKHLSKLPNQPQPGELNPAVNRGLAQTSPINMSHFKALIEQPDAAVRKRYRLRWDWHLRNFLTALVPPAVLLIFIQLIRWRFAEDMDEYAHLFPTDELLKGVRDKSNAHVNNRSQERRSKDDIKASLYERLIERLDHLEKELDLLRAEGSTKDMDQQNQDHLVKGVDGDVVAEARKISKTIVRKGSSPE